MRQALIFISGWGADGSMWQSVIRSMRINVADIHIPWWGCLDETDNFLLKTLKSLSSPVTIVGWSLGSMIALAGAADFPEKVAKLILVSGMARMTETENYRGADSKLLKAMRVKFKRDPDSVVNDFADICFAPVSHEKELERFKDMAKNLDSADLLNGLYYLERTDLRAKIKRLEMSTLILHGNQDRVIPFSCGQYLADTVSQGHIVEFQESGHALPLTQPEQVARAIEEFLDE